MIFEKQVKNKVEEKIEEKKPTVKKYLIAGGIGLALLYFAYRHGYHEGWRDGMLVRR